MRLKFELTGETAILFHADDVIQGDSLKAWRENPDNAAQSVRGDDRSPAWTWMSYLYSDGSHLAIPGDNLMAALRWAGAKMILKKMETYKSLTQSGLLISSEFCTFRGPKGTISMAALDKIKSQSFAEQAASVKELGFSLYVKRAKIGTAKHVRVRARFDEWTLSGQIEILNSDISLDALRRIFDIAGDRAGLLDWRPSSKQSPGPFGRFTAKLTASK